MGGVTGGGCVGHQDTPPLQQGEDSLHLRLIYVDVLKQHDRETYLFSFRVVNNNIGCEIMNKCIFIFTNLYCVPIHWLSNDILISVLALLEAELWMSKMCPTSSKVLSLFV